MNLLVRPSFAGWVCAGAILLTEGAILSARVDAAPLEQSMPQWWAAVLANTGVIMPVATAIMTATLLFAGASLRENGVQISRVTVPARWSWPFLVVHCGAFLCFYRVTVFVFDGEVIRSATPALWAVAWVATGLVALGLCAAIVMPVRTLLPLAKRMAIPLMPSVAIGMIAWGAGQITEQWWSLLRDSTFRLVHALLRPVFSDLIVRPGEFIIGTKRCLIEIAPKCSGYEGIGLIAVFLGVYLWLFRRQLRFPQALLLLPVAVVAVWIVNAVRIAALILVGSRLSPDIALGGFHSYSGSLLFCGLALGVVGVARRSPFFMVDEFLPEHAWHVNPTAGYLAPLLLMIATAMATGALSAGELDVLYPLRVVVAAGALWFFRRQYEDLRWSWSWVAIGAGAMVFGLWIALSPSSPQPVTTRPLPAVLADWPAGWAAAWLACRVVGFVVATPLAEELAFRGYLTRRLIATEFQEVPLGRFSWLAFTVSSVLFGALHDRFVLGTLAGMVYALVLYRRGKLCDAVFAHATTNALLAAYVLSTGTWSAWG